jgi:hypothetical protein
LSALRRRRGNADEAAPIEAADSAMPLESIRFEI